MGFYDRFAELCDEHYLKPQAGVLLEAIKVKSATVTGWKKGIMPSLESICNIADFFDVTTDYLLGRAERETGKSKTPLTPVNTKDFTPEEIMLLKCYRGATPEGRFRIIGACLKENK